MTAMIIGNRQSRNAITAELAMRLGHAVRAMMMIVYIIVIVIPIVALALCVRLLTFLWTG